MWLAKKSGGTEINWRGARYTWDEDGAVTEVPVELGMELLAIRGGGYSEAPVPGPEQDAAGEDAAEGDGGEEETPKPARRRKASVTEN